MKVKLAKTAGFCMGVRRAMEIAFSEAKKDNGSLFTYGPLIHNQQVLDLLKSKGVSVKKSIQSNDRGRIIIRAHGVTPEEKGVIKASHLKLIDATCPKVLKVQAIIKKHYDEGYTPIIFGDANHPEVTGLMGYAGGNGIVINSTDEIEERLKKVRSKNFVVVSQTTQDVDSYSKFISEIKNLFPDSVTFNTICDETYKRQGEVKSLASEVDSMVIVGGKNSGNTKRLYEISKSTGKPAFQIETEKELNKTWFSSTKTVGVTAGASTPNWMITRVIERLKTMGESRRSVLDNLTGKAFRFLMKISIPESIGAFSLTYASLELSMGKAPIVYPCLAMLYIYSMHVLNRFLDKEASKYNDPGISAFYIRHRAPLIATAIAGVFLGLFLSLSLGIYQALVFLALSVLGLTYNIPIIPWRSGYLKRYTKIKDLPGSKTLVEAIAWGTISVLLPFIGEPKPSIPAIVISFIFVFSLCYVRLGLFDVLNIQGDSIVGKETLPIALGEERTMKLLFFLNGSFTAVLMAATLVGIISGLGYPLLLCFIMNFFYLTAYYKKWIRDVHDLRALAETNFLFAGLLTVIWKLI